MSIPTAIPNPSTQPLRYNLGCKNGGKTVQICTDLNFNIVQCSDALNQYKYNTVLCDCDDTFYLSNADNTRKKYKGRYCEFGDNTTCNGNGTVNYTGQCTCKAGFFGPQCQFSRAANCNGRGTPQFTTQNGISVFTGCICENSVGNTCQYTRENTCNGHGTVSLDQSTQNPKCTCDSGWGGPMCKYNNARCNNNGRIRGNNEDACDCNDGFRSVDMQQYINRGLPTPRPTGFCNDCESGRGPWNPGDSTSCRWTWVSGRPRLTNNCYYYTGGNCAGDINIQNITNRGKKIHSLADNGDSPGTGYLEECNTTRKGACDCTSGFNTQRCAVTGYFEPSEQDQGCNNEQRGGYSCVWGSR